jgi:hypothetical protein
MRQFVYEAEEDETEGVKKVNEVFNSKIVYRKQKPVKILTDPPKVRNISTNLRKAAIQYIIKYGRILEIENIIQSIFSPFS